MKIMKIFLSYRRSDTALAAHALRYALQASGHEGFVDTGNIGGGEPYRRVIAEALASSQLLLALIGPSFDAERLRDPSDPLAFEWQKARFFGVPVVPVLVDGGEVPSEDTLPASLRWVARYNALHLRPESYAADFDDCVAAVPALARVPRRAARVLWVDDRPANNEQERAFLRPYGIVFDCVVSTREALKQLEAETYDLVITDMGRAYSSDRSENAGVDLLRHAALSGGGPPVIVYAGQWAVLRRAELASLGAFAVMSRQDHLYESVLAVLGRRSAADASQAVLVAHPDHSASCS